jgi:hypothetical protein
MVRCRLSRLVPGARLTRRGRAGIRTGLKRANKPRDACPDLAAPKRRTSQRCAGELACPLRPTSRRNSAARESNQCTPSAPVRRTGRVVIEASEGWASLVRPWFDAFVAFSGPAGSTTGWSTDHPPTLRVPKKEPDGRAPARSFLVGAPPGERGPASRKRRRATDSDRPSRDRSGNRPRRRPARALGPRDPPSRRDPRRRLVPGHRLRRHRRLPSPVQPRQLQAEPGPHADTTSARSAATATA